MIRLDDLTNLLTAEPLEICRALHRAGHDAVIVGGTVRDVLMGVLSNDVDIATSALPSQVRALFPRTFVQGRGERHGTIGVIGDSGVTYEVTTYRRDIETDGRHARVMFTSNLEEDLARRDFTINAMAVRPSLEGGRIEIVDPFGGVDDLWHGIVRAVGNPRERFHEDYLRIIRAIRMAARYDFVIDSATWDAMLGCEAGLAGLSRERARDELLKLSAQASSRDAVITALRRLRDVGFFRVFIPEIAACEGVTQNEHHAFTVDEHLFHAAAAAAELRPGDVRFFLAALLHDIGKPDTRSVGEDGRVHFYGHEDVGAELARKRLGPEGLALSTRDQEWIVTLIAHHMDLLHRPMESISARQLRRLWKELKEDNPDVDPVDLGDIRYCDKAGSGIDDRRISREILDRYRSIVEEVRAESSALRVTDLAVDGRAIMERLGLERGGPIVGTTLRRLLDLVVDRPELNTRERLLNLVDEIDAESLRRPAKRGIG